MRIQANNKSSLNDKEGILQKQQENLFIPPIETSHLYLIGVTNVSATSAGLGMVQCDKSPFGWIDTDFDNWDAQTISKDTKEAIAYVYGQTRNDTFADVFNSFNVNLDLLEIETHKQIKVYVKESSKLLPLHGCATYFLYKNKSGKRFVADVRVFQDGTISVDVNRFKDIRLWYNDDDRFVILIQKP